MRTSVKFVSALAVITTVACSDTQRVGNDDLARAQSLRSELANSGLQSSSQAVVSDLEVPPVAKLTPARAGKAAGGGALGGPARSGVSTLTTVSRNDSASMAATEKPAETAAIDKKVGEITVATPILDVVTPTTAPVAVEVVPVSLPSPRPVPMEPVSAGDGRGSDGVATGGPMDERPPVAFPPTPGGIIIRGGTTRDPCAVHAPTPGRTTGTVLINNRIPATRGTIRFPGGIR